MHAGVIWLWFWMVIHAVRWWIASGLEAGMWEQSIAPIILGNPNRYHSSSWWTNCQFLISNYSRNVTLAISFSIEEHVHFLWLTSLHICWDSQHRYPHQIKEQREQSWRVKFAISPPKKLASYNIASEEIVYLGYKNIQGKQWDITI